MATTRSVLEYTVTLGAEGSKLSAVVQIVDEQEIVEPLQANRVVEIPVPSGSSLETTCRSMDSAVIAALAERFQAKDFTRPSA